ncbi:MAG: FAD-dependent oxidoreductase [Marinobacter sp.]|nr:FAD-dependent oxidoreductase [Marinobacter sp.]
MKSDNDKQPRRARRRFLVRALGGGALVGGLLLAGRATATPARLDKDRLRTADTDVVDVAIIGAGLAGLTSARDLQRAGCESFVVLEARDRVGGRTYNHELGNGVVSEAGGQWIGPGQTAIADLARQLEVDTFDQYYQGKTVYLAGDGRYAEESSNGGASVSHHIARKLNEMARSVPGDAPWTAPNAAELDHMTVGEWLSQQNVSEQDKIGFDMSTTLTFGSSPAGLSLLHYLSIINTSDCSIEQLEGIKGGAQETRFVGGSQILCTRMAEDLGDKLKLSCPVRKISGWDEDVVELHTDQGVIRARQVITALSPALCNQFDFSPALPSGRAQLQANWPAHAPMRKTVHVYPRPFWRDKGLNGQIMQLDGPVIWSYDNSPPDGSVGVINAFINPGQLPHDPKQAESVLTDIYARALGEDARHPTQFHDHDWGKVDPWSLSCIHPIPPGFWTQWGKFLRPPTGRLIWSGTETADIWPGAMDGAVRSGHRAAFQALQALTQIPTPNQPLTENKT